MKKRLFVSILIFCLLCSCFSIITFAKGSPIIDGSDVLTDEQEKVLSDQMTELCEKYNVDVAVYIERYMFDDTVQDAAEGVYDSWGYGVNDDKSGILLYVATTSREYWIVSNGDCYELAINDRGVRYIDDNILPYLKETNFPKAVEEYVDSVEYLLKRAEKGKMYNVPPSKTILLTLALVVGVPLVLAFVLTLLKAQKMNTVIKAQTATNYMSEPGLLVTTSKDIFLYSKTTKIRREMSSTNGGPRSSSRSRGGSRGGGRGGRGGSF